MTSKEINILIESLKKKKNCRNPQLEETHISWVILCDDWVYKIKKPVKFSFLDFSNLERRAYFCQKEVTLNKRLADQIYIGVVPIVILDEGIGFGESGKIIDYAVKMKRMNSEKRMDLRLEEYKVTKNDIANIADQLIVFHENAAVISDANYHIIGNKFEDILRENKFIKRYLGDYWAKVVNTTTRQSNDFVSRNDEHFQQRSEHGFVVDGHGDLHAKNIFLLPKPVIFDCIEFDDELRFIDVLNDVAFLYMDMEARGYSYLAKYFLDYYRKRHNTIENDFDQMLFLYFVAYRANIRAKVNILNAKELIKNSLPPDVPLLRSVRYLALMNDYMRKVNMIALV